MLELIKNYLKSNKLLESSFDVNYVFSGWITPSLEKILDKKYKDLEKTREGQLQILEEARDGDRDAIIYLYKTYLPLVLKAYWKYFIGPDKKAGSNKITQEGAQDFLTHAYELLSDTNETSPYKTFDPSKFDDNANLIKQFSYYFFRYLQNEAIKLAKKYNKGAFSSYSFGKEGKNTHDMFNGDMMNPEEHRLSIDDNSEEVAPDHSDSTDLKIILDDFTEWLRNKEDKRYSKIFILKRKGYSLKDIAEKMNLTSEQYARSLWNKIKGWFIEKYPEAEA